jgi:hypothetical protein
MPIVENIHPELNEEQLFQLWLKLCPPYRQAMFLGRPHAELPFRGMAKQMQRTMRRVAELHDSVFTALASGPSKATGSVTITWTTGTTDLVGVTEGAILFQAPWGPRYRLTETFEVPAGSPASTQRTVAIAGEWTGFDYNIEARDLSEWAPPLDGTCDPYGGIDYTAATTDAGKTEFLAGIADGSITFTAQADLTGGAIGTLDLLASEKGMPRAENESDDDLRRRLMRLPLTVTPANVLEAINEALAPYGVEATLSEWWEDGLVVGEWVVGEGIVTSPPGFVIIVPNLDHLIDAGLVVSEWVIGEGVLGDDTSALDGLLASLQAIVDRAKVGGTCGRVIMEEAA